MKRQYIIRTVTAGDTIEVYKTQSHRFGQNLPRGESKQRTTERMQQINRQNAENRLRWLMNENFRDGDYHLVFTYRVDQRPESLEQGKKDLRAAIRRMQRGVKKSGVELRYLYVSEMGKRGAIHHHMVASKLDTDLIRKAWPHGRVFITPLYTGQYAKLAGYFIKQSDFRVPGGHRYIASRNLQPPKISVRTVRAKMWRKAPDPPEGYTYNPDFPLTEGVCEETGAAWQRCGFIRIRPGRGQKRDIGFSTQKGKAVERRTEFQ